MSGFTEEERQRRRERCLRDRPWEKSTGARSPEGKQISSQNALKHGLYSRSYLVREEARQAIHEARMQRVEEVVKAHLSRAES